MTAAGIEHTVGSSLRRPAIAAIAAVLGWCVGCGANPLDDAFDESSEDGDAAELELRWIEVAASDYKLELEPSFNPTITEYTALADGPNIEVYVDVTLSDDVEGVTIGGHPAEPSGFRTWRSQPDTDLVAPTQFTVEIVDARPVPSVSIEITVP
jgi:hypothetical protein